MPYYLLNCILKPISFIFSPSSFYICSQSCFLQDIVAALLRQRSPPESVDFSASANSGRQLQGGLLGMSSGSQSQPISLVKKSSGSGDQSLMTSQTFDLSMMPSPSTAGPFLMPQMMGMMQVNNFSALFN